MEHTQVKSKVSNKQWVSLFFVGDVAEIFEAAKCHLFKP